MKIRRHLSTVVVALVAGSIGAGAPAIAHGVEHALFAHNADRVDDKHAVGSGASVTQRKGKLVATSPTTGRLPNNIIARANDADRLDGLDSSDLMAADRIYVKEQFFILDEDQNATPHALCEEGDVVIGGAVWGRGLFFNSEGRYQVPGEFGIGTQGWRADVTATSEEGDHFYTLNAFCFDVE
jgi:hypothetical protein